MMFLKAAINGGLSRADHPAVPLRLDEIVEECVRTVAAGADVVHTHTFGADGGQSIAPDDIAALVRAVRRGAPGIAVGTTAGLWTCDGQTDRLAKIGQWSVFPDFVAVTFSEDGADEAASLLVGRGIELESAVWSLADVPALLDSRTLHRNVRILIEPQGLDPDEAVNVCREARHLIREAGVQCPLLYHGDGPTVWPVFRAAIEDGVQVRIGFEDGVELPDGAIATDNVALVQAAIDEARMIEAAVSGRNGLT
jgi:uncharacterized protein (DUF849 family)